MPDGDTTVYFSYNQNTGEIVSAASSNKVDLQTDNGVVPMAPGKNGSFAAFISGPAGGTINVQVLVDDQPVGEPQSVDAGKSGRVKITADVSGQIKSADTVETAP